MERAEWLLAALCVAIAGWALLCTAGCSSGPTKAQVEALVEHAAVDAKCALVLVEPCKRGTAEVVRVAINYPECAGVVAQLGNACDEDGGAP